VADLTTAHKVRFGAEALTSESERGKVAELVVDAESGAALAVGVRFGLFGRPVYASMDHVIEATDRLLALDIPRSAMVATPPADGERLTPATPVTLDHKRAGKLTHLTFEGVTNTPVSLVVDRGVSGEYAASAKSVAGIESGTVALESGRNGSGAALLPYHPDSELREDVRRAIEQYGRMRVDVGGITIQAVDGVIWLRGFVSSELNRRLVEDLSRHVVGVIGLHNQLVTDPDLTASIAAAIAREPATASERIGVYSELGRVSLRGAVRTAAAREAAGRIAESGFGARHVANDLRVDPNAAVLPVLAGVTNDEDAVPGGR
jgi:osmotically-inducible protein OsmY